MKRFNVISAVLLVCIAAVFVIANLALSSEGDSSKPYRVEIERLCKVIDSGKEPDISGCEYVTAVVKDDGSDSFFNSKGDYRICQVGSQLYRFDYKASGSDASNERVILNISLGVISVLTVGVLLFIRFSLLRPFNKLSEVPYKLSKGEMSAPLKENKGRYFGKFVWGVNMLRENMIGQKEHELELMKEKQTMILSISHDIRTPLMAIKLNSKAISKGLYTDSEKLREAAQSIDRNACDIEKFVTQLTRSASEDLIKLDVEVGEFYLEQLIDTIRLHYTERLKEYGTQFSVQKFINCLIKGDADRSAEVMQNLMENAIKYGDGKYIEIRVSEEEDCKLVCVANSGCTLPENELVHIFDSFWRGSNTGEKSGSGLGLYICRQLMLKMGGEIFAHINGDEMCVTMVLPKA